MNLIVVSSFTDSNVTKREVMNVNYTKLICSTECLSKDLNYILSKNSSYCNAADHI